MTLRAATTWDWQTRVLHWGLALCAVLNLFVLEEGGDPHEWVGYTAVFLLALRMVWGFVGSTPSRFSSFPISPKSILSFFKSNMNLNSFVGHNPLASLTYIAIWSVVFALGVTGFMMGLDRYWGDEWLENLHSQIATALQVLIGIHLLGIFIDSIRYRRKTWLGMITGKKS